MKEQLGNFVQQQLEEIMKGQNEAKKQIRVTATGIQFISSDGEVFEIPNPK